VIRGIDVLGEERREDARFSKLAAAHFFDHFQRLFFEMQAIGDDQFRAGSSSGVDHGAAIVDRLRHGFFAKDMNAGRERANGEIAMEFSPLPVIDR